MRLYELPSLGLALVHRPSGVFRRFRFHLSKAGAVLAEMSLFGLFYTKGS